MKNQNTTNLTCNFEEPTQRIPTGKIQTAIAQTHGGQGRGMVTPSPTFDLKKKKKN